MKNYVSIPCTGCMHARNARCTLNPPVRIAMVESQEDDPDSGWAFPPATERCGQFKGGSAIPGVVEEPE